MKKELLVHFSFWFSIFVLVTIITGRLDFNYWPFFIGGIVGTILPDVDHLIYIYLIKPTELTSQRFAHLLGEKDLRRSIELLYETRNERRNLIFHTQFFQVLFLVVTLWVMSSSGSVFGRGVALAFAIHLSVDQLIDLYESGKINDKKEKMIWLTGLTLTMLVGLM